MPYLQIDPAPRTSGAISAGISVVELALIATGCFLVVFGVGALLIRFVF